MKKRRKRKSRYHTGIHVSLKVPGKEFKYRSGWEEAYFKYLDANPDVITYDYECLKIPYISNKKSGKVRNYKPDFLITFLTGQIIVEIKPSRFVTKRAIVKKLEAGRIYAETHGMRYQIVTEHELKGLGLI